MDVKGFHKALPVLFKSKITPLIIGPQGVGKSHSVAQYAKKEGYRLVDLRIGQMADAGEIVGLADFDRDEMGKIIATKFFQPHFFPQNKDDKVILFLDEINRGTKDILQAVFELIYDGRISINGFELGENMHVIAAMNPATDDFSVLDFDDKAFNDRFCHIKFEPTVKDWLDYARNEGVDGTITGFIGEQSDLLDDTTEDFALNVTPSRRSWMAVNRIKNNCADQATFRELVMGMVGTEAAASYFSYASKYDKALKAHDILNNYSKVKDVVEMYSSTDNNRQDLLRNVCDQIKEELGKVDTMTKKWEKNLADFIVTIPKDLGYGFLTNELFQVESFLTTESDSENGLAGGNSKPSKQIIDHFEGWKSDIKEEKTEV